MWLHWVPTGCRKRRPDLVLARFYGGRSHFQACSMAVGGGSHPCSRRTEARVPHWLPSGPTRRLGTEGLATQRRHSASKTRVVFCSSQPLCIFPDSGLGEQAARRKLETHLPPAVAQTAFSGGAGSARPASGPRAACAWLKGAGRRRYFSPERKHAGSCVPQLHSALGHQRTRFPTGSLGHASPPQASAFTSRDTQPFLCL